jgi:hypothetical protein
MNRWGALLLAAAVGGCSSGITAPGDMNVASDLSAGAGDMTGSCTFVFGGDVSLTTSCNPFLCHPIGGGQNYDSVSLAGPFPDNPHNAHARFSVDGTIALRTYPSAELLEVDVGVLVNGVTYRAEKVYGEASLTISDVPARPSADPGCDGVMHGTVTASLVERVDADGGQVTGPGRATLAASF